MSEPWLLEKKSIIWTQALLQDHFSITDLIEYNLICNRHFLIWNNFKSANTRNKGSSMHATQNIAVVVMFTRELDQQLMLRWQLDWQALNSSCSGLQGQLQRDRSSSLLKNPLSLMHYLYCLHTHIHNLNQINCRYVICSILVLLIITMHWMVIGAVLG